MEKHVFIVGSKGIPANYGGYETFVEYLTEEQSNHDIQYHVACKTTSKAEANLRFVHNNADCFNVYVPQIGPAQAIYYDVTAIKQSIQYVIKHHIEEPIFYVLACRIGPFFGSLVQKIHDLGGIVYVNPDGHEWLRAKWSYPVRKYWKLSEKLMIKNADLLICDSKNIERYIQTTYERFSPQTTFIAYGAEIKKSELTDDNRKLTNWFSKYSVREKEYYLIVGRFVPENNYETMIREFMKSETQRDLVIITNVEHNKFYQKLKQTTNFNEDSRIKFVGTVYDAELLKKIREEAFAYLHGHSVGGTNPSLLEALASTQLNLLFDVGFNREVARESAFYWSNEKGNLSQLINDTELLSQESIKDYGNKSLSEVAQRYSWNKIINEYQNVFIKSND